MRERAHRVVVTGMGIVSCIGNTLREVEESLRGQRGGIRHSADYAEFGLRSQVTGIPDLSGLPEIPRRHRRYMGDASLYAYHALREAIDDAGLGAHQISHPRTGIVVGSGIGSGFHHVEAVRILKEQGANRIPPYLVPRIMGSTTSACLSTAYGIQGVSYSLTSACATSAHCIGHAAELIQAGKQDLMFAGGSEEACWTSAVVFDAMGALSTHFNTTPATASRPFEQSRDGFVLAGGGGMLVLESLAHAEQRGARIYAELVGYGACSDGGDMVNPDPAGAARAMRLALSEAGGSVDYVNAHATSTVNGDISEVDAIRQAFGDAMPLYSSTKAMTGHPIGAAGVHESIYALLMLHRSFVTGSPVVDALDSRLENSFLPVTRSASAKLSTVMSNSFGFGGTNASLIYRAV